MVVRGPSGSGKTTLLMTLGAMLRPSSGRVLFDGRSVYELRPSQRSVFRSRNIGFIFQMFHLVPYLNMIENVLLAGIRVNNATNYNERANRLLEELGLFPRRFHRPCQLSAGEKQRTAIARALLNGPKVLLADEPTGNLDPENAKEVLGHLRRFRADGGIVVLVTHTDHFNEPADVIVSMKRGCINHLSPTET